jgi:prephenate dehydrogenase
MGYYRTMPLHRVSILGVGLLGGSIGLAARSRLSNCTIAGYGHRRPSLDKALEIGAIDEGYDTAAAAVQHADLVILCTPVGLLPEMLRQISPALPPNAIVTDVGSTKQTVVAAAEQILPPTVHFVGSHPMAGSEKRGIEYARTDMLENATCIITPTKITNAAALTTVDEFWRSLGMHTTQLSPEQHDRHLADISHLPHALAAALVTMQSDAALPLAGKGFLDATRIAGGDGGLWRDILQDNCANMLASLRRLQAQLAHLTTLLAPEKHAELEAWLNAAASRRDHLLQQKLHEVTPD